MRPWPGMISVPSSRDTIGHGRNGRIHQFLQGCDFALNGSAFGDVDYREPPGVKDIAGHDDIGTTKEDYRIAIGMRGGLMEDFNALAVEVHVFPRLVERFGGPRLNRIR